MTALWGRGVLRQRKTKIDRRLIQNPAYGLSRFPFCVFALSAAMQAAFLLQQRKKVNVLALSVCSLRSHPPLPKGEALA